MTRRRNKAELYAVVSELRALNWTTPTIASVVGCTDTRVRTILTDLGLHHPVRFPSPSEALASLDDNLAARVRALRRFGKQTSEQDEEPSSGITSRA